MKNIFLITLIAFSSLSAEVITLAPYSAVIDYNKGKIESIKSSAKVVGLYTNIGNLNYLVELNYSYTNVDYSNASTDQLAQNDITFTYARYFFSYMLKTGLHYIDTTDEDLGDGYTIIGEIGGYSRGIYSKHNYGLDIYYSRYENGHDEKSIEKSIDVIQTTPFYSYFNYITNRLSNKVSVKLNYIYAKDYKTKSYLSVEIDDTIYYGNIFIEFSGYFGSMKSAVRNGGHTVYNTKDTLQNGYGAKLGYYIVKNMPASIGYSVNNIKEYGARSVNSNNVIFTTLSYSF
jgi:hypothetical protein